MTEFLQFLDYPKHPLNGIVALERGREPKKLEATLLELLEEEIGQANFQRARFVQLDWIAQSYPSRWGKRVGARHPQRFL